MTDIRLPSSGNIQVRWHADNAFANAGRPTPTEVNAGLVITDNISWNDFDFGFQASTANSDPSLAARSNVTDRGAMNYGGTISLYVPLDFDDSSNGNKLAWDALHKPRTLGWITIQIDGELSETNVPTYVGGMVQEAADGDLIHVMKVMTSAYSNEITGEEAFRETITLLSQGDAYAYTVVSAAAPVVAVTPATATPAEGAVIALAATVNGRAFTRGVRWTTSNAAVATVSQNGIVTIVGDSTDTVTITATYMGQTDTSAITVA